MPRNRMFKPSFARPLAPQSAHRIHKNFIGINAFCFLLKYFNHANILNFLPSAKPAKTQTGIRVAQKIKPVSTLPKNAAGICSKPDVPYTAPSPPKKTENKKITTDTASGIGTPKKSTLPAANHSKTVAEIIVININKKRIILIYGAK